MNRHFGKVSLLTTKEFTMDKRITKTMLLQRGWAKKTIETLGPKPKIVKTHAGIQFLYLLDKVEKIEKSIEFQTINKGFMAQQNRCVHDKRIKDE